MEGEGLIDLLLPDCIYFGMTFETFNNSTISELNYYLNVNYKKNKEDKMWDAQVAYYEVVNIVNGFVKPSNVDRLEKSFPSLFGKKLNEDEQEARFVAMAKQRNAERGIYDD